MLNYRKVGSFENCNHVHDQQMTKGLLLAIPIAQLLAKCTFSAVAPTSATKQHPQLVVAISFGHGTSL